MEDTGLGCSKISLCHFLNVTAINSVETWRLGLAFLCSCWSAFDKRHHPLRQLLFHLNLTGPEEGSRVILLGVRLNSFILDLIPLMIWPYMWQHKYMWTSLALKIYLTYVWRSSWWFHKWEPLDDLDSKALALIQSRVAFNSINCPCYRWQELFHHLGWHNFRP